MAIPISALIASLLLFQSLSRTSELTAFRAAGLSFRSLLAPLLWISLLLSLANFSICAEVAPYCKRETKELLYRETTENPLLLLQRQKLMKLKHAYLDMKVKEEGEEAKNLKLIVYNQSNKRLSLLAARKLQISNDQLLGYDVAMISHLVGGEGFDPLIIENQSSMSTETPLLSTILKKNRPRFEANSLGMRMLRLRSDEGGKKGIAAEIEILRRISLSLSVFSFTLLGCAFGIEPGRNPSKKGLFIALGLSLFVFMSYLLGKELKKHLEMAFFILLLPHPLIWIASFWRIKRVSRGIG